jgi:triosephosphate isomerase
MKKLIIANWKMNPIKGVDARKMFQGINTVASKLKNVETVVCPPLVYLESLGEKVTTRSCVLGAQDAFWEHAGPYTGQVSPDMIFNTKARYVIVGHSEVRKLGETDEMVNKKITSILQFPLIPVICVGETARDDDGGHIKFVKHQVKQALEGLTNEQVSRVVIAYEPVWAIGAKAKRVCTSAECREVVQNIRHVLADILGDTDKARTIPILYGGSVDDKNVEEFLIDGIGSGGISRKSES